MLKTREEIEKLIAEAMITIEHLSKEEQEDVLDSFTKLRLDIEKHRVIMWNQVLEVFDKTHDIKIENDKIVGIKKNNETNS